MGNNTFPPHTHTHTRADQTRNSSNIITTTITTTIIIIIIISVTIMSYHDVAQVALVAQAKTTCLRPSALYAWDGMVQRLPCPMVLLQRMQAIGAQGHKIVMLQSEL